MPTKLMHASSNRPGEGLRLPDLGTFWQPGLGLSAATSNCGRPCVPACSWLQMAGAFRAPMTIGRTRTAAPATPKATFFRRFNPAALRFLMIDSIRLLRFDPVTPDTQASGDDKYNLQITRMF